MDQDNPEHLFVVNFDYYPNFEISDAAKEVFDRKIDRYLWVLLQNGYLRSARGKVREVWYYIDFSDVRTFQSFNMLPRIMSGRADPEDVAGWAMKVFEKHIPEWNDTLCIDMDGNFFIREFKVAWKKHANDRHELSEAVARERQKLG